MATGHGPRGQAATAATVATVAMTADGVANRPVAAATPPSKWPPLVVAGLGLTVAGGRRS